MKYETEGFIDAEHISPDKLTGTSSVFHQTNEEATDTETIEEETVVEEIVVELETKKVSFKKKLF